MWDRRGRRATRARLDWFVHKSQERESVQEESIFRVQCSILTRIESCKSFSFLLTVHQDMLCRGFSKIAEVQMDGIAISNAGTNSS